MFSCGKVPPFPKIWYVEYSICKYTTINFVENFSIFKVFRYGSPEDFLVKGKKPFPIGFTLYLSCQNSTNIFSNWLDPVTTEGFNELYDKKVYLGYGLYKDESVVYESFNNNPTTPLCFCHEMYVIL